MLKSIKIHRAVAIIAIAESAGMACTQLRQGEFASGKSESTSETGSDSDCSIQLTGTGKQCKRPLDSPESLPGFLTSTITRVAPKIVRNRITIEAPPGSTVSSSDSPADAIDAASKSVGIYVFHSVAEGISEAVRDGEINGTFDKRIESAADGSFSVELPYENPGDKLFAVILVTRTAASVDGKTRRGYYSIGYAHPEKNFVGKNLSEARLDSATGVAPTPVPGLGSLKHRIFVSTGTWIPGNVSDGVSGVFDADRLCAREGPSPGEWFAFMSDGTTASMRAIVNGAMGGLIVNMKGQTVAENLEELLDSNHALTYSINFDAQQNAHAISKAVWTGTLENGNKSDRHCDSWTSVAASAAGTIGQSVRLNRQFLRFSDTSTCDNSHHLYCIDVQGVEN